MSTVLMIIASIGGTGLVGFLLGKISDDTLQKWVGRPVFAFFAGITIAANRVTGGVWNKAFEPFFKKVINVIVVNALSGLDSDNNNSKYGA